MGQLTQSTEAIQSNLNWHISKDEGSGIKVDTETPTFPWVDLIGLIQPNTASPTTSPVWSEFRTGINGLRYNANDVMDCVFHIPHDWAPGTDAEFHIHWGNDSALVENDTFTVTPTVMYGDRDGIFGSTIELAPITYTAGPAGLPQYSNPVTEVPLCRSTPTANQIDCDDIEVDGLIIVSCVISNISIAGNLFIWTADIHHQSTGIGTKNNASPFYT